MTDNNGEKLVLREENKLLKYLVPLLLGCILGLVGMMWNDVKADIEKLDTKIDGNTGLINGSNSVDVALMEQVKNNKEGIEECRKDIRELRSSVSP